MQIESGTLLRRHVRKIQLAIAAAICSLTISTFAADALKTVPVVEAVVVDGIAVPHDRPIVLARTAKRVEFHYTIPTFLEPERVVFRHRLRGRGDDRWIDAGHRRVATYTKLSPGAYEFTVAASSPDGWVTTPSAIRLRLPPPFHRTAWFFALCFATAASLAWLFRISRLRSVRLRHAVVLEERTRIAREFHDTIAQGLTGLTLHVEGAINNLDDPNRASEYLQVAKTLARSSLTDAKRALFDLRPKQLERNDLVTATRAMLELMTDQLPVLGSMIVRGNARRLADPRVENNLLRIAQEAVTNALRHSRARNIEVVLDFEPALVRLLVRDDGQDSGAFAHRQFEAAGNGVRGMRERAAQIGASFAVRRNGRRGIEIAVEAPV